MSTISDLKSASLRTLGYTGSTNDMYRTYLQAITGSSLQSINDLEKLVLGTGSSAEGRWKRHLDLHGIRGQSLPDMLYRYWSTIGASGMVIPYLFRDGKQGVWFNYSDFSNLFQDSAGTIAVTAAGQPIGRVLDKSGNNNHKTQGTSTARPLLQQDSNLKYYLDFDGIDDGMATSSITWATTQSAFIAFHDSGIATQTVLLWNTANTVASVLVLESGSATVPYGVATSPVPTTYVNGVVLSPNTRGQLFTQATNQKKVLEARNYGLLNGPLGIGKYTSFLTNGNIYGLIVAEGVTTTQAATIRQYLAKTAIITL